MQSITTSLPLFSTVDAIDRINTIKNNSVFSIDNDIYIKQRGNKDMYTKYNNRNFHDTKTISFKELRKYILNNDVEITTHRIFAIRDSRFLTDDQIKEYPNNCIKVAVVSNGHLARDISYMKYSDNYHRNPYEEIGTFGKTNIGTVTTAQHKDALKKKLGRKSNDEIAIQKQLEKEIERRKAIPIKILKSQKPNLQWYKQHKEELLKDAMIKQNAVNHARKLKRMHSGEDYIAMEAHMNIITNKDDVTYENSLR